MKILCKVHQDNVLTALTITWTEGRTVVISIAGVTISGTPDVRVLGGTKFVVFTFFVCGAYT